jgi:hypothetical protein
MRGISASGLDQEENAIVFDLKDRKQLGTNHVWSVLFGQGTSVTRSPFFEKPVLFDSGDPLFLAMDNFVILLGTYHGDNYVDECSSYLDGIQFAMDELCPGFTMEFSSFMGHPELERNAYNDLR